MTGLGGSLKSVATGSAKTGPRHSHTQLGFFSTNAGSSIYRITSNLYRKIKIITKNCNKVISAVVPDSQSARLLSICLLIQIVKQTFLLVKNYIKKYFTKENLTFFWLLVKQNS